MTYYEIEKQKIIGNYRVDFFITQKLSAADGSTVRRHSIVEFDEAAHKLKRYKEHDKRRDCWFVNIIPKLSLSV
jgi:very-short-patch-repair endonuclease